MYQKVHDWNGKPYRFICVEITDTTGKPPLIASGSYFIEMLDSTSDFRGFYITTDYSGRYKGLFPVDVYDELAGPVTIIFGYSIIPWAVYENIDVRKELIPLDAKYDSSAPPFTMELYNRMLQENSGDD